MTKDQLRTVIDSCFTSQREAAAYIAEVTGRETFDSRNFFFYFDDREIPDYVVSAMRSAAQKKAKQMEKIARGI